MADLIGALRVAMRLDSAAFESGGKRVRREASLLEKNLNSVGTASRVLLGAIGVTSVGMGAMKFLHLADESKTLTAQLKLATAEFGSFAQAQADVKRIAGETRTDLKSTADLYATLQRNAGELGISQAEAARATETITKAFRISGATAAEAAGGLRQFLQGIQSGTLRGEELNSVLENAPELARILANELGVTIGQLRKMGQEGKLTGEVVLAALADASDEIDRKFAKLPKTFDEAMTTLHNAAVVVFGAFDRGGQFSTMLANFVTDGTDGFADLEHSAADTGAKIRASFVGLKDAFQPLLTAAQGVFGQIEVGAMDLANRILPLLKELDWIIDRKRELGDLFTVYGPGESPNLPKSNIAGRFAQGFNESLTNSRRRMGMTPVSRALGKLSEANDQSGRTQAAPSPSFRQGGGSGGGRRAGGGGRTELSAAAMHEKDMADTFAQVLNKVKPLNVAMAEHRKQVESIYHAVKKGTATEELAWELRRGLMLDGYNTESTVIQQLIEDHGSLSESWLLSSDQIQDALHKMTGGLVAAAKKSEDTTVRIAKTFKDMADETISALDRVAGAVRGGGFLDILSSLIGLGLQLGSIGVFGKKFQTSINATPRAMGGPVLPGGLYRVGERGPELFATGQSGRIIPNHEIGGTMRVEVVPSPYFDVRVDHRIAGAAPIIAAAGGEMGFGRVRQASNWTLR